MNSDGQEQAAVVSRYKFIKQESVAILGEEGLYPERE